MIKQKVLHLDIETSPNIGASFGGRWEVDIVWVEKYTELLCFAGKFDGEKKVLVRSLHDRKKTGGEYDYKGLVQELHDLMSQADIIVAHNGNSFDLKMANRFFVRYGLPPLHQYKKYDTKVVAKTQFNFYSNKLDDLARYLGIGCKINTGGYELWKSCMEGDTKAWGKMKRYNKQDVILLEKVYKKLAPFHKHPIIHIKKGTCQVCGGTKLESRGWAYQDTGKKRRRKFMCKACGHWTLGELENIS